MNRMCEFGLEFGHWEMLGKGILGGSNDLSKGMEKKEQVFRFGLDNTIDNGLRPDYKGSWMQLMKFNINFFKKEKPLKTVEPEI